MVWECWVRGPHPGKAREGVAILLNDVWHSVVIYFGYVSSRILWIKFSRVKVCVVVVYGPNERIGEKGESFWSDMERTVDRV